MQFTPIQAAAIIGTVLLAVAGTVYGLYRKANEDAEPLATEAVGLSIGERLGNIFAQTLIIPASVTYRGATTFGRVLVSNIPFVRGKFWRGMIKFCTHQYQKATNADVVSFHHTQTGIEPLATDWVDGDGDLGEDRGWQIRGTDEVIHPGTEGRDTERMGKATTIMTGGNLPYTARAFDLGVAEALDLEQVEGLIAGASVNVTQLDVWPDDPDALAGGEGAAVTDGGAELVERQTDMTVHASEAGLADAVVDLNDPTRISVRKWKDTMLEMVGTEDLERAEDRGYLSGLGKDGSGEARGIIKGLLIAGGVFIAYEIGPVAIRTLFGASETGGGGGGGGGGLPFLMSHASDLLSAGVV